MREEIRSMGPIRGILKPLNSCPGSPPSVSGMAQMSFKQWLSDRGKKKITSVDGELSATEKVNLWLDTVQYGSTGHRWLFSLQVIEFLKRKLQFHFKQ